MICHKRFLQIAHTILFEHGVRAYTHIRINDAKRFDVFTVFPRTDADTRTYERLYGCTIKYSCTYVFPNRLCTAYNTYYIQGVSWIITRCTKLNFRRAAMVAVLLQCHLNVVTTRFAINSHIPIFMRSAINCVQYFNKTSVKFVHR